MDYDVVIIGGGPAGLAAALTLGRSLRTTILFDGGAPRNAPADAMHNVLGRDGTPPAQLREDARRELAAYPTVELRDAAVASVAAGFTVTLASGEAATARRLLLATGVVDELPAIPGFAERWGRTVLHCPYCHGYEQRGKRLAVLGATPHHAFVATLVRRYGDDVVLLTNGEAPPEIAGLQTISTPLAALEGAATAVFADGSRLERDALFAGGPARQHASFAADLGCAFLPDGSVEVDEFGRTSVSGVSAAGDLAHRASLPGPMAAVSAATTAGMIAAVALDQELHAADTGLPSPLG
ncbi:MAG TPA: NAD(P)/FAD-dependent oxidoreductase [Solirubrobacter sp.]|nr:NAD(P)/FAD-dependent oxidoreductase [Solirubrobacter sp.]